MSEPSSLYATIHLSPSAREAFLNCTIASLKKHTDWMGWLNTQKFYGTLTESDINQIKYSELTVGGYLNSWITSPYTFGFESYDEASEIWIISLYQFAENYLDYISFLHVLRSVAQFKDRDGEDFILIHSYIWGDTDSDVAIQVVKDGSTILKKIPKSYLKKAKAHLKKRGKALSEMYRD